MIKHYLVIIACLLASLASHAQDEKTVMSAPLQFRQTGWNKALCMKNGNTMLFHFEPQRSINVLVFDSAHQLIHNEQIDCRIINLDDLKTTVFKGLFEVNGEAVLFLVQDILSKQCLVRMRFSGATGKLTEETKAGSSKGVAEKMWFYPIKDPDADGIAILTNEDEPQYLRCNIQVTYYNNQHQAVNSVPLDVERAKYDHVFVAGADMTNGKVIVTLDLAKMVANAANKGVNFQPAIYNHTLSLYYIPRGSAVAQRYLADMKQDFYTAYSFCAPNPFAATLNLLVYSFMPLFYREGLDVQKGYECRNLFFKWAADNSAIDYNWLSYQYVADSMRAHQPHSDSPFAGIPLAMFTNENGLTTVIGEGLQLYDGAETRLKYAFEDFYGDIAITQLDDDGKELWGAVLPHAADYESYKHYLLPLELAKPYQSQHMFDDNPEQITARQFLPVNTHRYHGATYIMYNESRTDWNTITGAVKDTIYNFEQTTLCIYKAGDNRQISKQHLLPYSPAGSACAYTNGASFDPQRGTYATLVNHRHNDTVSVEMAWRKLE